MKTFKLVSLQVVVENQLVNIHLEDGLIINREDEKNSWLIEAYTDHAQHAIFQNAFNTQEDVIIQVVISKKENDPASFQTKICSVKKLDGRASILFEGKLMRSRSNYAELLLDNLLQKGLGGPALMEEFKEKMKSKPRLEEVKK